LSPGSRSPPPRLRFRRPTSPTSWDCKATNPLLSAVFGLSVVLGLVADPIIWRRPASFFRPLGGAYASAWNVGLSSPASGLCLAAPGFAVIRTMAGCLLSPHAAARAGIIWRWLTILSFFQQIVTGGHDHTIWLTHGPAALRESTAGPSLFQFPAVPICVCVAHAWRCWVNFRSGSCRILLRSWRAGKPRCAINRLFAARRAFRHRRICTQGFPPSRSRLCWAAWPLRSCFAAVWAYVSPDQFHRSPSSVRVLHQNVPLLAASASADRVGDRNGYEILFFRNGLPVFLQKRFPSGLISWRF